MQELWPAGDPGCSNLFLKDCILWGEAHTGAGEQCEEEGTTEKMCYGLAATHIPFRFCTVQGEEVKESGETLSLGRSKVGGSFEFISHHLDHY